MALVYHGPEALTRRESVAQQAPVATHWTETASARLVAIPWANHSCPPAGLVWRRVVVLEARTCQHHWEWLEADALWRCQRCGVQQVACPHPTWRRLAG